MFLLDVKNSVPVPRHRSSQMILFQKKCTKLEKEAHEAAGHAFLLTSPSQLRQVGEERIGRLDPVVIKRFFILNSAFIDFTGSQLCP